MRFLDGVPVASSDIAPESFATMISFESVKFQVSELLMKQLFGKGS